MRVEFQNITKKYGKKYALQNFSTSLSNGIYGLLGANGAGKTTLLNIFIGVTEKDSGRLLIDGMDVEKMGTEFLAHIGYLPQYPKFYPDFTVKDFMDYIRVLKGISKENGRKRTDELLGLVNLADSRNKKIGALSGGMRQRLGIAQAMLNDPDILILDEPTAGLDPQERIRFRNLIAKFAEKRIVLLATHIVSDVEFIANQILLLKNGSLIRQDSPEKLEEEISGKVWTLTMSDFHLNGELDNLQISSMMRGEDGVHLRIISSQRPDEQAVNVSPNLEEVFLCYCGEGST